MNEHAFSVAFGGFVFAAMIIDWLLPQVFVGWQLLICLAAGAGGYLLSTYTQKQKDES